MDRKKLLLFVNYYLSYEVFLFVNVYRIYSCLLMKVPFKWQIVGYTVEKRDNN